jgi:hypothetical protein
VGGCAEAAPVTVKLFLNQPNFGFSDAESVEPTQVRRAPLPCNGMSIPEALSRYSPRRLECSAWQAFSFR